LEAPTVKGAFMAGPKVKLMLARNEHLERRHRDLSAAIRDLRYDAATGRADLPAILDRLQAILEPNQTGAAPGSPPHGQ
jgi:hypothetical protein